MLAFEYSTFSLSGTACATIWCSLKASVLLFQQGEWLPLTVIATQTALAVKLNKKKKTTTHQTEVKVFSAS